MSMRHVGTPVEQRVAGEQLNYQNQLNQLAAAGELPVDYFNRISDGGGRHPVNPSYHLLPEVRAASDNGHIAQPSGEIALGPTVERPLR